ncbi:hypothetical protein BN2476_1230070 [Paraburkholderia piptadeniae]|uniref:Uncharacterized protein n=1 Tax=Paraburkholderia piptadeniae TaxID=1701573 RepID=A0A1N7SVN8_9BURK|nr:hypothetical protein BN2476_1230070 [Paraburkholderia piptadeniae]
MHFRRGNRRLRCQRSHFGAEENHQGFGCLVQGRGYSQEIYLELRRSMSCFKKHARKE